MRTISIGIILGQLACAATAILVAPDSPCEKNCGNVLATTTGTDMQCSEDRFTSTPAGVVFQTCTNCELESTYSKDGQTDLQWMLYNTRYAVSWCLFGLPNNKEVGSTPCTTSTACGPLLNALNWNNLTKSGGGFDYCNAWHEEQVPKCESCLRAGDHHYLANYLTILDAACVQRPDVGHTISVEGTPFSTVRMNVTTPTPTGLARDYDTGPLTLGTKVGIAIGGLVAILALAGCGIVCNGRRRRRAFLRRLEAQHSGQGWPHPQQNTDMFETPLSQRPLRGWEDSPVSAPVSAQTDNAEKPYTRYFSPYNSQYNSPVSALEATNMQWPGAAWPSSQQEKLDQIARERQHQQAGPPPTEIQIGLAFGGDDPSIRSKPSNQSIQSQGYGVHDSKGKDKGEEYELYEVDSNGSHRMPHPPQAPVLHHPGYGRQPSFQSVWPGGLTEEDVRRGDAL